MKPTAIQTYKAFDSNLSCRGFKFEPGKVYREESISICERGFHSCKLPLDVLSYYPLTSRFAVVEASGKIQKKTGGDSKVCSSEIAVKEEIGLAGLIRAQVEEVGGGKSHVATTGRSAHAATTGGCAHAATTGGYANAATAKPNTIAAALGPNSCAKGVVGGWIVLAEYENGVIKDIHKAKVDGNKIKENKFYEILNGEIVEAYK